MLFRSAGDADTLAAPGSLGTLYAGARALDDAYFLSAAPDRDAILCPALPSAALTLLLAGDDSSPVVPAPSPPPPPPPPKRFFRCAGVYGTSCRGNATCVTDVAGLPCPMCRQPMTVEMRWSPGDAHGKLAQAAAQDAAAAVAKEASSAAGGGGGYVKEVGLCIGRAHRRPRPQGGRASGTVRIRESRRRGAGGAAL